MEFHHVAAADIATEPLEVGDDSKLSLVDVIDRTQGAPFCAGVCEVFPGAPVDFDYDDDAAVCLMLEGEITLTENGSTRRFEPRRRRVHPSEEGPRRVLEHDLLRPLLLRHVSPLEVSLGAEPEHHEHHLFHDEMDAQHKRDMEQLAKFGYNQELKRSLGFFSTFAIAFSFISATNGFYALFYYGLDIGGPAGLIWQWPIIVFGQFMVALVFAEAASHYPLAGGVYQWAKRFMGGTYGWFVAWMFVWALLATVAAVAFGVAPIVCSLMGWEGTNSTLLYIAIAFALAPMVLNILSVKVTAFFNNIGTVTEIIGLVVIAIALYAAVIFGKGDHQSLSVLFDTAPGAGPGALFGYGSAFLAAMLTGAWVMYGFDSAGGLAEETVNPTREVPRAMLFAIGITAVLSAFWLVAMVLAIPDVAATQAEGTGAIAYIFNAHFPTWVTDLFLVAVIVAIFVCCLAIQAATTPAAVRLRPRQDGPGLQVLRLRAPEHAHADDLGALRRRHGRRRAPLRQPGRQRPVPRHRARHGVGDRRHLHRLPDGGLRRPGGQEQGLAQGQGLLQPQGLGLAGQHHRLHLRRVHDRQPRLAAHAGCRLVRQLPR